LLWRRAYQAELLRQQDSLYYVAPEGDASLRRALQSYVRRARGIVCDAEQILVVSGSQQAIDLCARLLLDPDDAFLFEESRVSDRTRLLRGRGGGGSCPPQLMSMVWTLGACLGIVVPVLCTSRLLTSFL
jgi:hypothetical protein